MAQVVLPPPLRSDTSMQLVTSGSLFKIDHFSKKVRPAGLARRRNPNVPYRWNGGGLSGSSVAFYGGKSDAA
jgi:hypothetical protein